MPQNDTEFPADFDMSEEEYRELVSPEAEDAVVRVLEHIGALGLCATREGCTGGCPSGQECRRWGMNCVCTKYR